MLKSGLKQIARAAGYDVMRRTNPPQWSTIAESYYPVNPVPRWGAGKEPNVHVNRALTRDLAVHEAALTEIGRCRAIACQVPYRSDASRPAAPYWFNNWFTGLDALSLMGFLLSRKPARYLEIGSGFSTQFARHAIEAGGLATTITSIDPNPRREIDAICDDSIRAPLEECDETVFDELAAGDLLFFDGSHRVFTNSDVTAFFLDVMPRLKPGVLVHIHDIFWPNDYPPQWNARYYSEQYLLGVMLLCPTPPFRVILPNAFVATTEPLRQRVESLFGPRGDGLDIPFGRDPMDVIAATSFWIETGSSRGA